MLARTFLRTSALCNKKRNHPLDTAAEWTPVLILPWDLSSGRFAQHLPANHSALQQFADEYEFVEVPFVPFIVTEGQSSLVWLTEEIVVDIETHVSHACIVPV